MKNLLLICRLTILLLLLQPFYVVARVGEEREAAPAKPLSFIENKGQVIDQYEQQRKDIDFKVSTGGMSIFIGDGQIHYQWMKDLRPAPPSEMPEKLDHHEGREAFVKYMEAGVPMETYRLDVVLLGANKNAELIREEQQSYQEHYRLPQYSGTVSSYHKITYKNIYPNIDWVLYTNNSQLKYDFVVHPGGNPNDIKLKYKGATGLELKDGALTATTPFGSITEQKPYSYDAITKQEIASSFVLNEDILSFKTAGVTANGLVIDPFLEWATYYGGSLYDYGLDVSSNNLGDAHMTGYTTSTNNIVTLGAHQTTLGGNYDAFIVKFNSAGVRQWGTYWGGNAQDWLSSIECDPAGNVYVSGETYSASGIATPGAYQTVLGGSYDAVLAKFTTGGFQLWATYYGGSSWEYGDVTCDAAGNVYMGGETYSSTGIATQGAYKTSLGGAYDAFLSRWTSNGGLVWATYFGGPNYDWGGGVACDATGAVYFGGGTESSSGIATTGAHQPLHGSSTIVEDGFLSKWTAAGALTWATYYGGTSYDWISGVACDATGNVYASGYTYSSNAIATTGSHQATHSGGNYDGFIVKFSGAGVRQWGTYYGGVTQDYTAAIDVGPNNYVYVSGWTNSSSGIASVNGYKTTLSGAQDAFLVEFTAAGDRKWATYYGGTANEYFWWGGGGGGGGWGGGGNGMSTTTTGKLYMLGTTSSTSGIATTGAHQTTHNNGTTNHYDAFLTSWIIDTVVYVQQPFNDTVLCPGQTFTLHYWTTYEFRQGNVFTFQLSDASGSFTTPTVLATKADIDSGFVHLTIPRTMVAGNGYRIRIVASNPVRTSVDNGKDIRIKPLPQVSASSNSPVCEQATLNLNGSSTTTGNVTYNWSGPSGYTAVNNQNPGRNPATLSMAGDYIVTAILEGCESLDTTEVVINIIPAKPGAGSNSPVCPNTPMLLNSSSGTPGVTYSWTGPGFSSSTQNPTVSTNATTAMAGNYSVTASRYGCVSQPTVVNVVVDITTPTPTAGANTPLCAGADLHLTAPNIPGATYSWTGPNGFTSTQQNPSIAVAQPRHAGKYTVIATLNNCVSLPSEIQVQVNVMSTIGAYISPSDTICKGYTATFVGFPQNAGPTYQLQWYKNYQPIPGATGKVYASNQIETGDEIFCHMVVTGVCDVPIVATSDTFQMVVLPIRTVPSVTIKADPGLAVSPDQGVRFTAEVLHGGTSPKYQWYKNGVILPGAVQATLNLGGLYFGDKVSVNIISEDPCADEKNASDTVTIGHPTGIDKKATNNKLQLYPNPNKGSFTISGIRGREVNIAISNIIGQSVYQTTATNVSGNLQLNTNLSKGVYLIRLSSDNQKQTVLKFTVTD